MKNVFALSFYICILGILVSCFNPKIGFIIGGTGVCLPLIIAIWNSLK